jgi:hypothetical protein
VGLKWGIGWVGEEEWELLSFGTLCVFGDSSIVVVEGACVRDCRGLGVCTVGTIG